MSPFPCRTALGDATAVRPRAPAAQVREVAAFLVVGAVTTAAYLLLYMALHQPLGDQVANAIALLLTAGANTAANRRFSFRVRGRQDAVRHQAQGLVTFGLALALTSGSLAVLDATGTTDDTVRAAVLVTANVVAGALHFVLLRLWVFGRGRQRA